MRRSAPRRSKTNSWPALPLESRRTMARNSGPGDRFGRRAVRVLPGSRSYSPPTRVAFTNRRPAAGRRPGRRPRRWCGRAPCPPSRRGRHRCASWTAAAIVVGGSTGVGGPIRPASRRAWSAVTSIPTSSSSTSVRPSARPRSMYSRAVRPPPVVTTSGTCGRHPTEQLGEVAVVARRPLDRSPARNRRPRGPRDARRPTRQGHGGADAGPGLLSFGRARARDYLVGRPRARDEFPGGALRGRRTSPPGRRSGEFVAGAQGRPGDRLHRRVRGPGPRGEVPEGRLGLRQQLDRDRRTGRQPRARGPRAARGRRVRLHARWGRRGGPPARPDEGRRRRAAPGEGPGAALEGGASSWSTTRSSCRVSAPGRRSRSRWCRSPVRPWSASLRRAPDRERPPHRTGRRALGSPTTATRSSTSRPPARSRTPRPSSRS